MKAQEIVLRARRKAGLTQAQFAALVGTSPRRIRAYELGESDITLDQLNKFAEALNLTVAELIKEPSA